MSTHRRTLLEHRTSIEPGRVFDAAKAFFARRNSLYAAFIEQEGPSHVTFRGQGGEEIVLAAVPMDGYTLVTGSTYLFDAQVSRFFTTLPPAEASA